MLPDATHFFIDGKWVKPRSSKQGDVINPATEKPIGKVTLANDEDVNLAVQAASSAFPAYSQTSVKERLNWLIKINEILIERNDEIADAITQQMGAPVTMSRAYQATSGSQHFGEVIRFLKDYPFEEVIGSTKLRHEPVGVCALITPWNWPINQIAIKVAPALAAGCTMVLKPSELAPYDAIILAEAIELAGLPPGVFNLIHGNGVSVGAPLVDHKLIDMVSFTGSTQAGVSISKAAAIDVKRVSLELGGKSAAIVLDDADFNEAIPSIVGGVMLNSGQSCNARSRLLVPKNKYTETKNLAVKFAQSLRVGSPNDADTQVGPLANQAQYERVIAMINTGIDEGADLLTGGTEKPDGLKVGFYITPTIFGNVTPNMRIAREEIFGPVMTIHTYNSLDEAVHLANDSEYGLSGSVWSEDHDKACAIASKLRTGMVHINGAGLDTAAPFGGYKKSGNGREWGRYGLEEFLEVKSVYGANPS